MLTESEIIGAVRLFLESNGFQVHICRTETEQGIDIEATAPDGQTRISIEAKGETSSRPTTARFGRPFSPNQALDHLAKAFYCAARDSSQGLKAGIALPRNEAHERHANKILPALRRMGIEVFWVLRDRRVETERVWEY
jgi:hypothetical protein